MDLGPRAALARVARAAISRGAPPLIAALAIVPLAIGLWWRDCIVLAGAGLLLGYALFKALGLFYVWNPDHVVHRFPDLTLTPGYLLGNLQNPDVVVALGGLLLLGLGAGALVMRAERRDPASLAGTDGWRWVLGAAGLLLLISKMRWTKRLINARA